ncbi:MAG TPA: uracil-DNA glycosylase [Acidimicrobiales bacterium]|nr:uracil-DNA glycosylase [Acidimicrobiales bacterium]
MESGRELEALTREIESCRACPRLVAWRERVAGERRASFRDQEYWGRPVGGFGDPGAAIAVVGLAPAAHGANRTGRIFTGDRSGDWLFASMHRVGLANQAASVSRDDGLELYGIWVTASVRCAPPANKPSPAERDRCLPYLERELALIGPVRVVVVLGQFAYDVVARLLGIRPKPRFGHGVEVAAPGGRTLICSYHPSQQNTFTGKLTEPMTDAVFTRAAELSGIGARPGHGATGGIASAGG